MDIFTKRIRDMFNDTTAIENEPASAVAMTTSEIISTSNRGPDLETEHKHNSWNCASTHKGYMYLREAITMLLMIWNYYQLWLWIISFNC